MMKSLKPKNLSKLNYFQLSREYEKSGLLYSKYRNLLRFWERYEKIEKLGRFNPELIKEKDCPNKSI